ncbi:MAG: amidase [Nitriliruptoraceae bacterium]
MTDLAVLTARDIVEGIRAGQFTAVEVTTAVLQRIVNDEAGLGAWAHVDAEAALAQARACDARAADGDLHGVPVGIKDIIDTADQPTAYGSPIYASHRPQSDAAVVTRLRTAGAVIVGKKVTTEFPLFQPGPTVNPHDASRTPGGSSSGSAAAVAARMVPLALGTQTAGSIVRPASFCGVFGLKPTFGRVPVDGIKACAVSLDTVGAFARTADDLAIALGVMSASTQPVDISAQPRRIGVCRTPQWDALAPTTRAVFDRAVAALDGQVEIVQIELPPPFEQLVDAQQVIMGVESLDAFGFERMRYPDQLSERLSSYLNDAQRLVGRYDDAVETADACRSQLPEMFRDVDALLAPAVIDEAPSLETTGDPLLCRMWTLLGVPAVAVPGLVGPNGLPLGIQVIAPSQNDAAALAAAAFVERVLRGRQVA